MKPPALATRIGPDPSFDGLAAEERGALSQAPDPRGHFPGIPRGW